MLYRPLREPEIQNLCLVPLGDENVGGLDVAMKDAFRMRCIERICNLYTQIEQSIQFHRLTVNRVLKRLAFQQLHGDEVPSLIFSELIDRADGGMSQR